MRIPLPVKILGAVLLLLVIATQAQAFASAFKIVAIVLWIAALGVVLHLSGFARAGFVGAALGAVTRVLAPGAVPKSAIGPAANAAAAPPQAKHVDLIADRGKALERGRAELTAMFGEDPARKEILDKLIPQARAFADKKKPLLGASRALVFLITGPHGVGKSMVARALADVLYGTSVVNKPVLFEVPAPTGSRLAPEWVTLLEESLEGIVLVDNAPWLLQTHPLTGAMHADGLFDAITQVANANPGKLAVLVTLADKQLEPINQRAGFKELIRRLTLRHHAMAAMDPQDLLKVLRAQLEKHGLKFPDALSEPARRLIKRYSDSDAFDNAEAMRRIAESLLEANPVTDGREVKLEELEAAFESKA
jgi:hypothetical protein